MPSQYIVGGPPGAGKSARVRELLNQLGSDTVAVEWSRIWAALRLAERDAQGAFPVRRPSAVDPLVTQIKKRIIDEAVDRDLNLVASTGSKIELTALRNLLPEAVVEVMEVPRATALANLEISYPDESECGKAVDRWFDNDYPDDDFDWASYWYG